MYGVTCFSGGSWDTDKSHNNMNGVKDLNNATVFTEHHRRYKPYKAAIEKGYIEVPAYLTRVVTIGVEP